jgi:hypothetical protein
MRRNSTAAFVLIYTVSAAIILVYLRGGIGVDYQRKLIVLVPILLLRSSWKRKTSQASLVRTKSS